MIKLTVEGVVYEFDQERLTLAEARQMKKLTGLTPPRWGEALEEGDGDAVAILIYMAKKRGGEQLRFEDLDNIDYADIDMETVDEDTEEPGPEGAARADAADPTRPGANGTIQTDATGATSPPSPGGSNTTPMASAL